MIFFYFPTVGNKWKKNNNMKKNKKHFVQKLGWATAQLYCKWKGNCIAIQSLYCREESLRRMEIVLQYRKLYCSGAPRMGWKCIAIHWLILQRRGLRLYCNTVHCIVTSQETWAVLYFNIATAAAARARGAAGEGHTAGRA